MKRSVYIFINGILTFPGKTNNWNRRAVTHFLTHHETAAESLEYLCFPLTRSLWAHQRAAKLAKKIFYYQVRGWEVNLVAHSNGANVIFNALRRQAAILDPINQVHLFSPACDANAQRLGLVDLLRKNRVGTVQLFRAGADRALLLADLAGRPFGYGALGRNGFRNLPEQYLESGRVRENFEAKFDHGTWFEAGQFNRSMSQVAQVSPSPTAPIS